ncbi:MAG: metallophosphoesterase [Nocardiopsaceae bacterium]|jgi:predicted MPP superfamily phosphohydrolase|nr:metallophosphoesterase [Nocardiopsaceae bacterium]
MPSRHLVPALALLAAGGAATGYASVIERNWFVLRRVDVPVLPADAKPVRVLHISDAHLTPGRTQLLSWIRSLDATEPDLVVNTGDSIAHPRAVQPFLDALGPLLDRPGAFVYGSNDLYSPVPKNPTRYLWGTSAKDHRRHVPDLPWEELGEGMAAAGWLDLNNRRGRLKAGELDIEAAGLHDPHIGRDRYAEIAGRADPAADLRLAVMHSPEPRLLDRFADDGYDLLLAGHTHGGQVCLPVVGPLVTNCDIDRRRARGLSRHPAGTGPAWLHVSAGLGTSPWAPVRFCCRPEATMLTLLPRIG